MHVLITGGTGFIGSSLVSALLSEDHRVTILSRKPHSDTEHCHYVRAFDAVPSNERFDAVVNLAGESLAARRWTTPYKRKLYDSRLDTTTALVALLQQLETKPSVLLSASAIGYYGHHGDCPLSEDAATVPGFAQQLCQRWEALASSATELGVRVCLLRLGVVLDRDGGAMVQLRQPFDLGVANWLGDGRQWLSWIHRRDVIRVMQLLLSRADLSGAFNVTAPGPVTNRDLCRAMRRHRRTFITLRIPAAAMRLLVGEMADELLLNGQRVVPTALQDAGFSHLFPQLDNALTEIFHE